MPDLLDDPSISEPEEEEPDSEQQPDYGPANKDLPKQLVDAIRGAIVERQGEEKFTRRREILRDRKLRFYEYGHQHIFWNNTAGGFAQSTPGGVITNSQGQSAQCPSYIDDYNIFCRYLLILISTLSQSFPGLVFQPIDPSIPEDNDKAKAAEDYAKAFDRMNDTKSLQKQMYRMMGLSGRTVSWTRTEADAQRFGKNDDGTPKTFQRTTIYGSLETKVLIMCKEVDAGFPYVLIYDDPDVKTAKAEYPDFAEEIKAGSCALNENQYERTARLGVLVGSRSRAQIGDSLTHLTARVNAFLRCSNFVGDIYDAPFTEGEQNEEPMSIGDKLRQLFPDGVRAVFVGDTYVGSYAECIDDHIDIQFPYEGDGMFRQTFMECLVVVQDGFNDLMNWIREKIDTGAGALWVRGDEVDIAAVTSQRAAPNAIRPGKQFARNPDRPIADSFYKEEDPQIPETLIQFLQILKGELPEFLVAALPALQGNEMSENKTASGYAQATIQAKGQLGIIWGAAQRMWARIRYQSALAASRCDEMTGEMKIPGARPGQGSITLNMDKLKKGDFGCYPDEDSSFPESTQQKRAILQSLMTMAQGSPQLQQLLDNPDNVEILKREMGFEELVFPPAESYCKQLHEIELLLQGTPLKVTPEERIAHAAAALAAREAGLPEPPAPQIQPSIPVDDLDFHQWEGAMGQIWMSSAQRRQEDSSGNQEGVLNVKLHVMQHLQRAAAMQAAIAPVSAAPTAHKAPPPHSAGPPAAPPAPAAPGMISP